MGKAIQHFCALTQLLDGKSVIFLIQEKSCFLTVFYIHFIFDAVFLNLYQGRKFRSDKSLDQLHSFLSADFHIASLINSTDYDTILSQYFFQKFNNLLLITVNSQSQGLNHQHIGKLIHYNSRQKICFCKNKSAASCIHYLLTVFPCIPHTFFKKFLVNLLPLISGKKTHCNFGICIDKSLSHGISIEIMNQHCISIYKAAHNCIYLIIKNPHTSGFQKSAFPLFQGYHCKTHILSSCCS